MINFDLSFDLVLTSEMIDEFYINDPNVGTYHLREELTEVLNYLNPFWVRFTDDTRKVSDTLVKISFTLCTDDKVNFCADEIVERVKYLFDKTDYEVSNFKAVLQ